MAFDPISAGLELANSLVERIWKDPETQSKEKLRLAELAQSGDLEKFNAEVKLLVGQMEINKQEAASGNLFVAGWRPFVGWVCGFALLYAAILEPFMRFIAKLNDYTGSFPVIDTNITMQILMGMLGLGMMRTREKEKGVDTKSKKTTK